MAFLKKSNPESVIKDESSTSDLQNNSPSMLEVLKEADPALTLAEEAIEKADACIKTGQIMGALIYYEDGIQQVRTLLLNEFHPIKIKQYKYNLEAFEKKLMDECTKMRFDSTNSALIDKVRILENERGKSYHTLFAKYFTRDVTEVHIYEPQICKRHHFEHFYSLLTVLLKQCDNCSVRLITQRDNACNGQQVDLLQQLAKELKALTRLKFSWQFLNKLLHRHIVISNGYVISLQHGLHFYQPCGYGYCLGAFDYDYRKCIETSIEIWKPTDPIQDAEQQEFNNNETQRATGGFNSSASPGPSSISKSISSEFPAKTTSKRDNSSIMSSSMMSSSIMSSSDVSIHEGT